MSGNSYVQPNEPYLTTKPNLTKSNNRCGWAWHGMYLFIQYERKLKKKEDKFNTDLTRNTSRNVNKSPKIFPINRINLALT
jgi:hypothetical protein